MALFMSPQDIAAYNDMFEKLERMAAFGDEARAEFPGSPMSTGG
jgi:hypothetical protein